MSSRDDEMPQQTREIPLPDGSVLELSFNDLFCAKVRKYFEIDETVELTDELLKEFFAASLAGI